ncbi:HAD hydrolase-like protein [Liquorilactobacillus sicerae]|uniref:HAD hydrolase-like protein n=1 Tax=Liquorilactobacillus sicerae TaxID=1416943 RepID=UPI00248121BA|nr:HAD hydrolase-like protein [Liquorilactobacillus sicerae]
MTYQSVFFDLDGTLTDPQAGITKSIAYALQAFGIEVRDLNSLTKFIGPALKDSLMKFYNFSEADAIKGIKKYREYYSRQGMYDIQLIPGITDLLKKLKHQHQQLFIATAKPTFFAIKILDHFDLSQYFDGIFGSNLDGTRAQKSEVITYGLQQTKLIPSQQIAMVGDRSYDIQGAKENHLTAIGVLYGYGSQQELTAAGVDHLVSNVHQLSQVLTA